MGFGNCCSFFVGFLFVRFVMTVIRVDNIEEFANFMLEVVCLLHNVGIYRFLLVSSFVANWWIGLTFQRVLQRLDPFLELVHCDTLQQCPWGIELGKKEKKKKDPTWGVVVQLGSQVFLKKWALLQ